MIRTSDNGLPLAAAMIFFAALCVAILVLNRWAFTDLGLLSYGRVWQLYISYADFGFLRRGLIGTLFSATGLSSLFANAYVFAFFVHNVAIVLLAFLIARFCIRQDLTDPLFIVGVAFSPALIIHSGYTTGSLDVFVLLLAVLNILYVRNSLLFGTILIAGILTHELFIFTLPAQFWAFYFCDNANRNLAFTPWNLFPPILAALAIFAVTFFGQTEVPEFEFKEVMRTRIPDAFEMHPLWSGYLEVGSSVETNLTAAREFFLAFRDGTIFFLLPSLLYLSFLALRIMQYVRNSGETLLLAIAIAAPLLTSLLATDFHRWVAMSANMALLVTLKLAAREGSTTSSWNIPVALYCFLAPFGSAELARPFPLHQFVWEHWLGL